MAKYFETKIREKDINIFFLFPLFGIIKLLKKE